jgi:hypothetical protein
MAIYREHGVNPFASLRFVLAPLALVAASDLPSLYLTGRSLPDLLAGTVVVLEDR